MTDVEDFPIEAGDLTASRFHIPQANRDLQSNWEFDLVKNLEEYLLKICSGEISDENECSINFAEAALLVQGSVQVYSRKVEYLHSLVLAALEFLSQKRQDQQQETTSEQPNGSKSAAIVEDDDEVFLGLDDVPVDPKNCFGREHDKEEDLNNFLKPPANLLVLEGDCLDSGGDAGELESYLLFTCNFYKDFLLLDPCDAGAVHSFLQSNCIGREQPSLQKGSSIRTKNDNIFTSPTRRSTPRRSSVRKKQGIPLDDIPEINNVFEQDNGNAWSAPHIEHDHDDGLHEEEQCGVSNAGDDTDSEDEDPWKPLNAHDHGNLKIKSFKASTSFGRQATRNMKPNTVSSLFPIAKLEGIISPELAESFEVQTRLHEKETQTGTQSPCYFEKLRRSFIDVEENVHSCFDHDNDDNGVDDFPDFDHVELDTLNNRYDMDIGLSPNHGKNGDNANFDGAGGFSQDDPSSQASLEDLCRSHLDALLASIAETETQTELATRVSTWKHRIEQNLEEQDSHPPFDIHLYGDRVLDVLSSEIDSGGNMTFTDVVRGQPKHDVARTFSALLQLVNNGDVELQKAPPSSGLICYTSKKPFRVKLLRANKKRVGLKLHSAKKRAKCSSNNKSDNSNQRGFNATPPRKSSNLNGKTSNKFDRARIIRCTPESSKRRKMSRLAETVDVLPAESPLN